MTQNKLIDLNNHLFCQLERLGDEDLTKEEIVKEKERSKAMIGISKQIIETQRLALDVATAISAKEVDATLLIGTSNG